MNGEEAKGGPAWTVQAEGSRVEANEETGGAAEKTRASGKETPGSS
jgi:hypothetical protein